MTRLNRIHRDVREYEQDRKRIERHKGFRERKVKRHTRKWLKAWYKTWTHNTPVEEDKARKLAEELSARFSRKENNNEMLV